MLEAGVLGVCVPLLPLGDGGACDAERCCYLLQRHALAKPELAYPVADHGRS
jgi:hypothetical protein